MRVRFVMHRRYLVGLLGLLIALAVALPVAAWASHSFSDVPDSDWAHDDIEWMKDNGLTNGCEDGTVYCPDDFVTRRELAAFTHRLALSGVVDAGTIDSLAPEDLRHVTMIRATRPPTLPATYDPSLGFEQIATLGTFVKARPETLVEVTFTHNFFMRAPGDPDAIDFCDFQLRIDGVPDVGLSNALHSGGRVLLVEPGNDVAFDQDVPAVATTVFGGLAAGEHTIEIWVRGWADTCGLNRGGSDFQTIVEEFTGVLHDT